MYTESVWRPGSARTRWGAYSALFGPLLDLWGRLMVETSERGRQRDRRGTEEEGMTRDGEEGREGMYGEAGQEGEEMGRV